MYVTTFHEDDGSIWFEHLGREIGRLSCDPQVGWVLRPPGHPDWFVSKPGPLNDTDFAGCRTIFAVDAAEEIRARREAREARRAAGGKRRDRRLPGP